MWASETELVRDFAVESFAGTHVVAIRKSDGRRGTLRFTHRPRAYFDWKEQAA